MEVLFRFILEIFQEGKNTTERLGTKTTEAFFVIFASAQKHMQKVYVLLSALFRETKAFFFVVRQKNCTESRSETKWFLHKLVNFQKLSANKLSEEDLRNMSL